MRWLMLTALFALPAQAQMACAPHDVFFNVMHNNPDMIISDWLHGHQYSFTTIIERNSEDWAIVRTDFDTACIMVSGSGVDAQGEPV